MEKFNPGKNFECKTRCTKDSFLRELMDFCSHKQFDWPVALLRDVSGKNM